MSSLLKEQVFYVSLEGNIGVGKSSVLKALKDQHSYPVFLEGVDRWKYLKSFYQEPKKYGYLFQDEILNDIVQTHGHVTRKITERSKVSSLSVFAQLQVKNGNLYETDVLKLKTKYSDLVEPTHIIYLEASPAFLLKRIRKRGRSRENSISLEYLKELDQNHQKILVERSSILGCDRVVCLNLEGVSLNVLVEQIKKNLVEWEESFSPPSL